MPTDADYTRFMQFLPFIFEWEGETFENDPDDPGGATKFGIDQRSHPDVRIRDLTRADAAKIYWKEWCEDGCNNLISPMAEVFFDTAVNCGIGRAVRWLEEAGGRKGEPETMLKLRDAHYYSISIKHKSLAKFLRGWTNRTKALRERFQISQ
jgi:lysozyme family protein